MFAIISCLDYLTGFKPCKTQVLETEVPAQYKAYHLQFDPARSGLTTDGSISMSFPDKSLQQQLAQMPTDTIILSSPGSPEEILPSRHSFSSDNGGPMTLPSSPEDIWLRPLPPYIENPIKSPGSPEDPRSPLMALEQCTNALPKPKEEPPGMTLFIIFQSKMLLILRQLESFWGLGLFRVMRL